MGDEADEAIDAAFACDDPFERDLGDPVDDAFDGPAGVCGPYADEVPGVDGKDENPPCPKCAREMVERHGPRGTFWGCSAFPKCRGTLPMVANIAKTTKVANFRYMSEALDYIVNATVCLKVHDHIRQLCEDIRKGRLV